MKTHQLLLTLVVCSALRGQNGRIDSMEMKAPWSHQPSTYASPAEYQRAILENMLYSSEPLPPLPLVLHRMGDRAALEIQTIMITRQALTVPQTMKALEMIHAAFARPEIIENATDRAPSKALQFLTRLQNTAVDQSVKQRVAAETTFVRASPQTVSRPGPLVLTSPPKPGVMPSSADATK